MKINKKIISIFLCVALLFILCACGAAKPHGTYSALGLVKLTFSGSKITMRIGLGDENDEVSEGTFKMEDDQIICTFEDGGSDTYIYDADDDTIDVYGLILEKETA